MRGKTSSEKAPNSYVPGPGRYNPSTQVVEPKISHGITFTGRPNSLGTDKRKAAPGPGNYNLDVAVAGKKGMVFGSSARSGLESKEMKKVPGPGAYNASEAIAKIMAGPKFGYAGEIQIVDSALQRDKMRENPLRFQDQEHMWRILGLAKKERSSRFWEDLSRLAKWV